MNGRRPSLASLVACFLILSPIAYVLSYAPVVSFCGSGDFEPDLDPPIRQGSFVISAETAPLADGSQYPTYQPVDWLIDNTPLRTPLYSWAGLWGVRDAFEFGHIVRNPLPAFGTVEPRQPWQ